MIRLKQILPDPCKTIQNLDSVMRTNISELRQKIERAKLITSTLQVLNICLLTFVLNRYMLIYKLLHKKGTRLIHTGKCIRRFAGIYAYDRYFIDRKW